LTAFVSFYFYGGDADELAKGEARQLSSVNHLPDLLGAAAPPFR
jgi:hypothetical protein